MEESTFIYYALRHKETQKYFPNKQSFELSELKTTNHPRLFTEKRYATAALTHWAKVHCSNWEDFISREDKTRVKADWEIVPMKLETGTKEELRTKSQR